MRLRRAPLGERRSVRGRIDPRGVAGRPGDALRAQGETGRAVQNRLSPETRRRFHACDLERAGGYVQVVPAVVEAPDHGGADHANPCRISDTRTTLVAIRRHVHHVIERRQTVQTIRTLSASGFVQDDTGATGGDTDSLLRGQFALRREVGDW